MPCYKMDVVRLALSQVGYSAAADKRNKYAAYIDSRFPGFYNGKKNGFDWCDVFIDALFLEAYGETDALRLLCQPLKSAGAGCTFSANYYKAHKRFGYYPQVGAQIFFSSDGKTCYHTGLVVAVKGNQVVTVEGNAGNKVQRREYDRKNRKIFGYGYPYYDEEVEPMPTVEEVAYEVINGKWGTGENRKIALQSAGHDPAAVQAMVNSILSGEAGGHTMKTLEVKVDLSKYNKIELEFFGVE